MITYAEFTQKEKEQQPRMDAFYRLFWSCEPNRSGACIEYDLELERFGTVEEKFRFQQYNDILVEIVQDLQSFQRGWFYTSDADYLFYITVVNGWPVNLWRTRMPAFHAWCLDFWAKKPRQTAIISSQGKGVTLNLSIPKSEIPTELVHETNLRDFFEDMWGP